MDKFLSLTGLSYFWTKVKTILDQKPGKVIDLGNNRTGEIFNNYTNNTASGNYSHAEGSRTTASNDFSHAEGFGTTASGICSHAEGDTTTASGNYSHAEGYCTIASSTNQHVQGKFNINDNNHTYAFIIGNGKSNKTRSNAFAIDWNGDVYPANYGKGVNLAGVDTDVTVLRQALDAEVYGFRIDKQDPDPATRVTFKF